MSIFSRSSSIDLKKVKREAKRLRKKTGIRLFQAQETIARGMGYQSFHELLAVAKRSASSSICCFDIETYPFSKKFKCAKSRAERLKAVPNMRLACVYEVGTETFHYFLPEQKAQLVQLLKKAQRVISYNGKRFDELVLQKHCGMKGKLPIQGCHDDLWETVREETGEWIKLDEMTRLNLGESKHTLGRNMKDCSVEELRDACKSDVWQTYRLWKMLQAGELRFPWHPITEYETLGQFLEADEEGVEPESILEQVFEDELDPFEEMTEGQFADALAGFQ